MRFVPPSLRSAVANGTVSMNTFNAFKDSETLAKEIKESEQLVEEAKELLHRAKLEAIKKIPEVKKNFKKVKRCAKN